jgi:RND family efflux transporter MFP subunit
MKNLLTGSIACLLFLLPSSHARAFDSTGYEGLIEAPITVTVGSPVAGVLERVSVDRGDLVKVGQVLATLQAGVEKAAMALAETRSLLKGTIKEKKEALEFAKKVQERNRPLHKNRVLSDKEWEEIVTRRNLAEIQLEEAYENLSIAVLEYEQAVKVVDRKTIRSPIAGVVVTRFVDPGEYVETQPILEIAQINPLKVEVILPVEMYGSIKPGMSATVKPQAPISGSYETTVKIVDRVVDAASGTFGVRLYLSNPKFRLPPGLKCKVIFHER